MKRTLMAAALATLGVGGFAATDAAAQSLTRITDVAEFNAILAGKQLRLGLMGIALTVAPDGTVTGSATGYPVTGTWSWQDGYFCREMDWGGTAIPFNCQLIEFGGGQMRVTSDRGAGDDATFNVR